MKKIYEGIKDFLYDSIDYIIIIGIIGIVVFVISWRLNFLFAKDALISPKDNTIIQDNAKDKIDPVENNQEENNENKPNDAETTETAENINEVSEETKEPIDNSEKDKIVKITIPEGSLPSKIASILESNKLISSKNDFIQKAIELKLDTKLKSGEYEIKSGSTLEEILKIIAKQ